MSMLDRRAIYERPKVVGYRKTNRKVATRNVAPDLKMVLHLPTSIGFGLCPGPVKGVLGVRVINDNQAEIVGKTKAWVCETAAKFIRKIAAKRQGERIQATMWRGDERLVGEITFVSGNPAVIIDGFAMRTAYYES